MNLNAVNPCVSSFSVVEYHDTRGYVGTGVPGEVRRYRKLFQPHVLSEADLLAHCGRAAERLGRNRAGDGLLQPFREFRHVAHAQPEKVAPGAAVQARRYRNAVSLDRAEQERLVLAALAGVDVGGKLMDQGNGPRRLDELTLFPQQAHEPAETHFRHGSSMASHLSQGRLSE